MSEQDRGPGPPEPEDDLGDLDIELFPADVDAGEHSRDPDADPLGRMPALTDQHEATEPGEPDPDTIVLEAADLHEDEALPPVRSTSDVLPPITDYRAETGIKGKKGAFESLSTGFFGSLVVQMLIAGAIGGFAAWALQEPSARVREQLALPGSMIEWLFGSAMWGASLGGLIGLALGAAEGVVLGAWSRAAAAGGLGLLIGASGGAIGGIVGQRVYDLMLSQFNPAGPGFLPLQMLARAIGWAAVGALVGLGPGVMLMAPKKIVNGLIGGLAGGFIAGILFDPIGYVFGAVVGLAGTPSRLVGIVVLGMCTGGGIGLAEEVRKEAWLSIIGGPLTGKQFIIYRETTWIGSSPGMDIPLMKDRAVAAKHCWLELSGRACFVRSAAGQTLVNGQTVTERRLAEGDVIQIGQTTVQYHTRPLAIGADLSRPAV